MSWILTVQINNLTVIFEIIKFPSPVRSYYQEINVIFGNIAEFLSLVLLYDNLVSKACLPYIFDSFQKAVLNIQLAPFYIVTLTGNSYNEIIPQFPCSFQNIVMSLVEQIKGTVSNDFFHY